MRGQKRQLEKARQERAAAKRERRHGRGDQGDGPSSDDPDVPAAAVDQDAVLAQLADLHHRFADGQVSLDDFEAAKAELLQSLRVD